MTKWELLELLSECRSFVSRPIKFLGLPVYLICELVRTSKFTEEEARSYMKKGYAEWLNI